jgi:aspartate/methionine/tyrosine aminotransferase
VARAIGARLTPWLAREEAGWALDLDELRRALRPDTRLVVVNFPHNPTGHLMSRDDFACLVALSQERGFLLFSDEVYRSLEYNPADRLPALCEVDPRGVSLGVTSKSYGLAGLRIGWVVTQNAPLLERLAAFKDYTTICSSAPSEFLATLALRHRAPIVARNLALIRKNLVALDDFFSRHAERFSWVRPQAGPIAFPTLRGEESELFCQELEREAGVLLLPGRVYGAYPRHFRVGFGREDFVRGLGALAAYLCGKGG